MKKNLLKITIIALISTMSVVGCSEVEHQNDGVMQQNATHHWKGCAVSGCEERFDEEEHNWSEWKVKNESTCTSVGEEERECSECHRKESRTIEKKNHSQSAQVKYDEQTHWYNCSICNAVMPSSKTEHYFETWTVVKEASSTEDGLKKSTCSCGYVKEIVIPKSTIATKSLTINTPSCIYNDSVLLSQGSFDLSYEISPKNASDYQEVTITSSNEQVATVNGLKVNLLKEGYTEITVSNGVKEDVLPFFVTNINIDGKLDDQVYKDNAADVSVSKGAGYSTSNESYVFFGDGGLYISHNVSDKYISGFSHIEASLCFGEECNENNTLFMNIYPSTTVYEQVRFFANPKAYNSFEELVDDNKISYASASKIQGNYGSYEGYQVEVFIPYEELEKYGFNKESTSVKYIPLVYQYYNQLDADRAELVRYDGNLQKNIAYGNIDSLRAKYLNYLMPTFKKDKSFITTNINPIVEYTFDNGQIVNTGTNQTVNGRVTAMTKDKSTIVDVDNPTNIFTTGMFNEENSAISLTNKLIGNHFTISGIDLDKGDFTISVKLNIPNLTDKTNSENYLFGIGNAKDVGYGFFNVAYKNNGNKNQIRFRFNGKTYWNGYIPVGKFVEVRIIRKGNNVTVFLQEDATTNEMKILDIALEGNDALVFSNCNLGFSSNINCSDIGEYPVYFDDIRIYDYAIPM